MYKSFNEFLRMAGIKISGEHIETLSHSPNTKYRGETWPDGSSGSFYINVHPDIVKNTDEFLYVLLHEFGHVRLHNRWLETGEYDIPAKMSFFEGEAKLMAMKWGIYARQNAYKYDISDLANPPAGYEFMARQLAALMTIPDETQQKFDCEVLRVCRDDEKLGVELTRRYLAAEGDSLWERGNVYWCR